jgi:release factor glutamine methyltransferase
LAAYREIAAVVPALLAPGGRILVEAGAGQASEISRILVAEGFAVEHPWQDLPGIDRVISAKQLKVGKGGK